MNEQFYDIVDGEGNIVETAEEQRNAAQAEQIITVNGPVQENGETPTITMIPPGQLKKMRKLYVTVKLPRVIGPGGCGHRLDLSRQPRHRNCQMCWFAWFNNHGELVQQLDEMHVAGGDKVITDLQGIKFLHRWKQFMATIAQWKQASEEIKNEKINN